MTRIAVTPLFYRILRRSPSVFAALRVRVTVMFPRMPAEFRPRPIQRCRPKPAPPPQRRNSPRRHHRADSCLRREAPTICAVRCRAGGIRPASFGFGFMHSFFGSRGCRRRSEKPAAKAGQTSPGRELPYVNARPNPRSSLILIWCSGDPRQNHIRQIRSNERHSLEDFSSASQPPTRSSEAPPRPVLPEQKGGTAHDC